MRIFLSLLIILMLSGCHKIGNKMLIERESPYDFNKTVEIIKKNALEMGWKNPKDWDFKQTMQKHLQKNVLPVKVLRICRPDYAYDILSTDEDRKLSVMMPCGLSVYEKQDGKTYISTMNVKMVSKFFSKNVETTMRKVSKDLETILGFLRNKKM